MTKSHRARSYFLAIFLLAFVICIKPAHVYAIDGTPSARPGAKPAAGRMVPLNTLEKQNLQKEKITRANTNFKDRITAEIDRRLTNLTELKTRVTNLSQLTDSQKTSLTTQIQNEIDTLTALKAKLSSETSSDTLKEEVKPLVQTVRNHNNFMLQIRLLIASNSLKTAAQSLTTFATRLGEGINSYEQQGNDVTELNTHLSEMTAQIKVATDLTATIDQQVVAISLEGDNVKTSLRSAADLLKQGTTALRQARQTGKKISLVLNPNAKTQ